MLMIFLIQVKAQNNLQRNYFTNYSKAVALDSNQLNYKYSDKKWFVSKYTGVSTSVGFFNDGNVTVFSAPIGLQLNRKLNNNWYAFAGISATTAYINFNHFFNSAITNKIIHFNSPYSPNNFNLFPKAELGLMFVNDQKTFSISGSISVEKSNYFFAPINQFSNVISNNFTPSRK